MSKGTTRRKGFLFGRAAVLAAICLAVMGSCPAWGWDTMNIPNEDHVIGTWDAVNRVFTLTTDVAASLVIVESDFTLEGAGFVLDGTTAPPAAIGIKIQNGVSGVTVQNVNILGFTDAIFLSNCVNNIVFNNTVDGSYEGIYVNGSLYNTIASNAVSNCNVALKFSYGNENTAMNNTFSDNNYGLYLSSSTGNLIYNNNFVNNNTQAGGVTGSTFYLPAPVGGNYWSNWTSPDADEDGVVDVPYAFVAGIDALPLVALNGWLPDIDVAPTSHDFGNVEVNSTRDTVVTITNVARGELEISGLAFTVESSMDFTIAESPVLPITLGPDETADVQITYTPMAEGLAEAVLEIASNDIDEASVSVSLLGVGEITELPPAQQMANILSFYEESQIAGTLVGSGPNANAAVKRLDAFGNMLSAASDLITVEWDNGAIQLLTQISRRCDGETRPPDFVAGDAAEQLYTMIIELIADLQS